MNTPNNESPVKIPALWISLIPLLVLGLLLILVLKAYGTDALGGGIQIALLVSSAVCVALSTLVCKTRWEILEEGIVENIKSSAVAIIIPLMIGAITGTKPCSMRVSSKEVFTLSMFPTKPISCPFASFLVT